ncbi:hypothetical protein H9635_04410 [Solibacillus sp. A46]|uniref:Uncharacterized protein n=1 Tax=Solibacillus faecavium TaxID=2762221 RepID=A0ABR8XVJ8_9BACL|nr:hypothetical protein [Solibacillus faecavium]MBD8035972.1 hypothetical protein [Solibacillus faecavium]
MINIFVGLIFVFFKTNLSFLDIGATYYLTNIIGYISILFGIIELGRTNQRLLKVRPYVMIMIAHSFIFFLLNVTGNSPLTMAFSTSLATIIAYGGLLFIVAGMFLIFAIISELLDDLNSKKNKKLLYNLINIMMMLFILAGISAYFNMLATTIMGTLLLLEVLFLISYYYVFLLKNENIHKRFPHQRS